MVYLNRIYTKSGDKGETSLGNGERVAKTAQRIIAYGTTDELNSVIGLVIANGVDLQMTEWLQAIQNDLFDLGADLSVPETPETEAKNNAESASKQLRITAHHVARLERWIDEANEQLQPLTSFVLPGGSLAAATFHLARTVCRRAEIESLKLSEQESVNQQVLLYLNRLSDLFFVLARAANDNGKTDILWVPGKNRGGE